MGINIDFNALGAIYSVSTQFSSKLNAVSERLTTNINKLSNPEFTNGLTGGQGDLIVEALVASGKVLEALRVEVKAMRLYVDEKITNAHDIQKDSNSIAEKIAAQKRLAAEASLKRS